MLRINKVQISLTVDVDDEKKLDPALPFPHFLFLWFKLQDKIDEGESRWVTVLEQSFAARINIWWFLCPQCHLSETPSSTQPLTYGEPGRANYFGTARIGKGSSAENLQDAKPGVIAHFPAGFTKCWCCISSFRGLRRCHHLLCFLWTCSLCLLFWGLLCAVYPTHPSKYLCILLIWQCKNRQGVCFPLVVISVAKLFIILA